MGHKLQLNDRGSLDRVVREDAVLYNGRWQVPSRFESTKWVSTWEEFKEAGGVVCFSEDQTAAELILPEPFKLSCRFMQVKQAA